MVKIVCCVRRSPELSGEEFHSRWLGTHAPLLQKLAPELGITRVVQVETVSDGINEAIRAWVGSPQPFDGMMEVWVESIDALLSAISTTEGRAAADELVANIKDFVDFANCPIWVARDRPLLPVA